MIVAVAAFIGGVTLGTIVVALVGARGHGDAYDRGWEDARGHLDGMQVAWPRPFVAPANRPFEETPGASREERP